MGAFFILHMRRALSQGSLAALPYCQVPLSAEYAAGHIERNSLARPGDGIGGNWAGFIACMKISDIPGNCAKCSTVLQVTGKDKKALTRCSALADEARRGSDTPGCSGLKCCPACQRRHILHWATWATRPFLKRWLKCPVHAVRGNTDSSGPAAPA